MPAAIGSSVGVLFASAVVGVCVGLLGVTWESVPKSCSVESMDILAK